MIEKRPGTQLDLVGCYSIKQKTEDLSAVDNGTVPSLMTVWQGRVTLTEHAQVKKPKLT